MHSIPSPKALAFAAAMLAMATPAAMAQTSAPPARGSAGTGYGFDPGTATPVTPHGQGGVGMIPPVERQYDAARRAGGGGGASAELLREADRALQGGDTGLANEQLERAATALLNQPGIETRREGGVRSVGPGAAINEARAALARNDIAGARRGIQEALAALRWADGATTGTEPPRPQGSQGGGAGLR